MRMKARLVAAIVASALLGAGGALTPGSEAFAQDKKPTVSRSVAKPLKAAQDAMQAKKYQEALAKLQEVQATAGKSPYDEFVMNELLTFVHARLGNDAEAARAIEANLNSQYLDQNDVPTRVKSLAQLNYRMKNYRKAIDYGNRAVQGGYADDNMVTLIAQSYYLLGDYKGTRRFVGNVVENAEKRGQTPSKQYLDLMLSSCLKMEDDACATDALERLVQHYPKPEYWQNLTYSLFRDSTTTDRQMLHVFRLANDVDVLRQPEHYTEMAQLALEQGSPGEAVAILQKGFEKNIFTEQRDKDRNQRLLESAKRQAAADQAALAKIEREATTGEAKVRVGQAYLSYGQYDKAAQLIGAGIAAGGVKNADEANILHGIALAKAGQKDAAIKAFRAVKGDPKYARLAKLWQLHVS